MLSSNFDNKLLQRFALEMSCYDCSIKYVHGKTNVVADFMSRQVKWSTYDSDTDIITEHNKGTTINIINSQATNNDELTKSYEAPQTIPVTTPENLVSIDMKKEQELKLNPKRKVKWQLKFTNIG